MELNAVVGLKRAIINREGLIQLNTEKLEGFQYAFYLRHSKGIEKKFYTLNPSNCFNVNFVEGDYIATFYYMYNNKKESFNLAFFIDDKNNVVELDLSNIIKKDGYRIDYYNVGSKKTFVIFNAVEFIASNSPFGFSYLVNNDFNLISCLQKNDRYQELLFKDLRKHVYPIIHDHDIHLYSSSLDGYRTLYYADALNGTVNFTDFENLSYPSEANLSELKQTLTKSHNLIYTQLESLSWLQRRLLARTQLPPLRGWACSPDVLLRLHTHIIETQPKVVVEFGSGSSTLVIADALSQNGTGKLISIDHSEHYGAQTLTELRRSDLQSWVDLRIGELDPWNGEHLNVDSSKQSLWYPVSILKDIENIDLMWVDGPPGSTCPYSRYPALPALSTNLSEHIEVWMDDTIRKVEKDICGDWSQKYGFDIEYHTLEKGLGILTLSK